MVRLQTAQAKCREGIDVVVGVVETHGRKETEALLAGLEVIPRRRVEYKGRWLDEMDIDAILDRRPRLVLVDELAHTNAQGTNAQGTNAQGTNAQGTNAQSTNTQSTNGPGSRHPKRYM